jgi:hypothetical protein
MNQHQVEHFRHPAGTFGAETLSAGPPKLFVLYEIDSPADSSVTTERLETLWQRCSMEDRKRRALLDASSAGR